MAKKNEIKGMCMISSEQLAKISDQARILIKDHLKETGKSVNKLAKQSGVHPTQLYLFLAGDRGLTDTSLMKIGKTISEEEAI